MAKILVADDNPLSLHFFCEAIAIAGHEPTAAADGLAARDAGCAQAFDLIVLDARMPGLDGAQALAKIRAGNGPSRSALALVTTAESTANRRAMRDDGFVDVIYKPIGLAALHATLARHLPGSPGRIRTGELLDDALAAAKTGGDASIIAALRGLFAGELDALPDELDGYSAKTDREALLDRLHRLDASAGFCGAPALSRAIAVLRKQIEVEVNWPHAALADLLATCMETRKAIV